MADNNQNHSNQSDRSDTSNKDSNQSANQNTGRENDLKNPDQAFDNPQDGGAWDNYRNRSFSSNPQSEQTVGGTGNTGNTGNTGSEQSSGQNR